MSTEYSCNNVVMTIEYSWALWLVQSHCKMVCSSRFSSRVDFHASILYEASATVHLERGDKLKELFPAAVVLRKDSKLLLGLTV